MERYPQFYREWGRQDADRRWVDPRRTDEKSTHPYSYSEFFIFGDRDTVKTANDTLYSDRIWQWDREKAERCWKQHVNVGWAGAGAARLSAFLSEYLDQPVKVIALAEGCNASNGYPYWIVWLKNADAQPRAPKADGERPQEAKNPLPPLQGEGER